MREITDTPNSLLSAAHVAGLAGRSFSQGAAHRSPRFPFGRALALALFALYALALMLIEVRTSQSYVRNFFADIEGPTRFHAINTSLSVWLLMGAALLFAVSASCVRGVHSLARLRWLYLSQTWMFIYFAIDDRFKIHESAGYWIGIGDHFIILAAALLEFLFLARLGGVALLRGPGGAALIVGWALAFVMISIDALAPHEALLRLSAEDLAKTGASLALFYWAWDTLRSRLDVLKMTRQRTETVG